MKISKKKKKKKKRKRKRKRKKMKRMINKNNFFRNYGTINFG
jgi:hypothetical protein